MLQHQIIITTMNYKTKNNKYPHDNIKSSDFKMVKLEETKI